MKRIFPLLIIIFALSAFAGCKKDEGPKVPGYIEPFWNQSEELSKQIQAPDFPVLKEGKIISWLTSYDEVLEAISDTQGYTIDEGQNRTSTWIIVTLTDTYWWSFDFDPTDLSVLNHIGVTSEMASKINKPYSVVKDGSDRKTYYYVYDNTIVAMDRSAQFYGISFLPRSRDIINKYKLYKGA